jgi:lyso-ornithine lipid O-acyltransferase
VRVALTAAVSAAQRGVRGPASEALRRRGRAVQRSSQLVWTSLAALGAAGRAERSHRDRAQRLRAALVDIVESHRVSIAVEGSWPSEAAVLIANHVSYLDPVILGASQACAPIAKAEFARWPILGPAAARLGVVFVDRGDPLSGAAALRQALAKLRAGVSVLAFPEGTTSAGPTVLPFHLGAFGLAALAGVPVVPIALRYASQDLVWTGDATFLPHYLRAASRRSIAAVLRIGAPLEPRLGAGSAASLAARRRLAARELAGGARASLLELLRDVAAEPSHCEAPRPAATALPAGLLATSQLHRQPVTRW